jgi:hypothetical protein
MTRAFAPALLPLALLALTGCTQFPALDRTITPAMEAADYPELVPLDPLLAGIRDSAVDPVEMETALSGRLARLRAKAARLRGPILSAGERARLNQQPG